MPTYPTYKLGDVAEYINGRAFKPKEWKEKGLPIVRIQNLNDENAEYHYSDVMHEDKYLLHNGDLLFAWAASLGTYIWNNGDAWLNQHIFKVIPKENVSKKYLYFALTSIIKELYAKSHGSGMVHVTKDKFVNTKIPLPPLPTQHQIVSRIESLFAELDKAVEHLRTAQQQLKTYRQAVLKNAFEPKVNWRCVKVSDIGEVNLGRQRSPKNVSKNFPTKYIRAANITEEGLDLSDVFEMEFAPNEREKYYLKENDILVSEASGSASQVGKPAIWRNQIENCCFQNTVIRHRITKDNPEYVFWYYKNLYVNGFFSRIAGGVGINHLGANKFSNIEIYIPNDISEQQRIVKEIETRLSQAEAAEARIAEALQKTEALRQSILKKAFSGELV